ncbi:hypothetical protein SynROS8604_02107 [Synechococcus sp. ROS8604]|nr:hypothetical protein SynROS8604_02107 [Synechococcus sp. ROS8604]
MLLTCCFEPRSNCTLTGCGLDVQSYGWLAKLNLIRFDGVSEVIKSR